MEPQTTHINGSPWIPVEAVLIDARHHTASAHGQGVCVVCADGAVGRRCSRAPGYGDRALVSLAREGGPTGFYVQPDLTPEHVGPAESRSRSAAV